MHRIKKFVVLSVLLCLMCSIAFRMTKTRPFSVLKQREKREYMTMTLWEENGNMIFIIALYMIGAAIVLLWGYFLFFVSWKEKEKRHKFFRS